MGGIQHNQGVECLKYLFKNLLNLFLPFLFFCICVAYLNECHLFLEHYCFLTPGNEGFLC